MYCSRSSHLNFTFKLFIRFIANKCYISISFEQTTHCTFFTVVNVGAFRLRVPIARSRREIAGNVSTFVDQMSVVHQRLKHWQISRTTVVRKACLLAAKIWNKNGLVLNKGNLLIPVWSRTKSGFEVRSRSNHCNDHIFVLQGAGIFVQDGLQVVFTLSTQSCILVDYNYVGHLVLDIFQTAVLSVCSHALNIRFHTINRCNFLKPGAFCKLD